MSYRDVFGEILADHYESPRNFGKIDHPTKVEQGYNPLCGDQVAVSVLVKDAESACPMIDQCSFEGEGCSICLASASMMTELVKGHSREEALQLIEAFRQKMQGAENVPGLPSDTSEEDLVALYGIRRFPVRIKCALLAWTTLKKALDA